MAQELTFIANGKSYVCAPKKVDRSKVYGSTEKVILDDNGNPCKAVSMDESGTIIIPKGGVALGIVNQNLEWVDRAQLMVVNMAGEKVDQIPSTFTTPINLDKKVSVEEFLDHTITTVYQLIGDYADLIELVKKEKEIYYFNFNYRNSYDSSPAFLITNGTDLFMLAGYKNDFEFLALQETSVIDAEEEETTETDDFDIDFSMM